MRNQPRSSAISLIRVMVVMCLLSRSVCDVVIISDVLFAYL